MTKTLLAFILCAMISHTAYSKTDTTLYYMKTVPAFYESNPLETGVPVEKKEDADFIRAVISPDKTDGLYDVNDYYLSGKLKAMGKSESSNYDVKLEGPSIGFSENGHKKRICTFRDGIYVDYIVDYFPNGRMNTTKTIIKNLDMKKNAGGPFVFLKDCLDSAGNVLTENGNGKWIEYHDDFKTPFAEGMVTNGFANGEWHGKLNDTVKYICNYTNGQLKEGKSYSISGKEYPFSEIFVAPEFKGGLNLFGAFLGRTLRYPTDAINKKIQGRVHVRFIVEKDGSLSVIRVVKSVYPSIDNEALNAIYNSPNWTPCYIYGIISRITYTVPISFTLVHDN